MSSQEIFVTAARKHLCVGRKSLSTPDSLNLATQVLAVDLGLKPALLFDSNGSSSEQVQQYLSTLQASQLVSKSVLTLDLNGNTLILNPVWVKSNLERGLCGSSVSVINISHSLEKPTVVDLLRGDLKRMMEDLLLLLRESERLEEAEKPFVVREKWEEWNLCTVFGLLLGYPATYWFDQTHSFENCLSMVPLMVTTVAATWQTGSVGHTCALYSFSIPNSLLTETQSHLDEWRLQLEERFRHQTILKGISVSQSIVTLPSVCL